tara:strand:- start:346 stop:1743 length:1398 start_codon:yes stop_codon:yes gene_type:complete
MVFPIAGGTQDTSYEISNSLRYNDGDSARLSYTTGSSGSARTFTWSMWLKRSTLGSTQYFFNSNNGHSDAAFLGGLFNSSDELLITSWDGGTELKTNRLFRDVSAWYHIVFAIDTTQSTNTNRVKMYINGTQETSFDTASYPNQNYDFTGVGNSGVEFIVGAMENTSPAYANFYDGYISEFNFVDGTAYAASDFGETNNNGVWVPKKPAITYGTNGYKLEFKQTGTSANSSGMGADTSGNDNHFTPSNLNAYDVVPDSPTNNYCVLNSVDKDGHTNAEGNLEVSGNVIYGMQRGTIGATSGKWYFEARLNTYQGDTAIALANEDENIFTRFSGETTNSVGYLADNRFFYNSGATNYSSLSAGNIFQIAFDADTGKIWIGKNNTWQNSGDPANGTGSVQTVSWNFFLPAARTVGSGVLHYNFGQDSSFGGHSTAQNNADGNGYGDFYYAPPTGFFALNTKNLAEYG